MKKLIKIITITLTAAVLLIVTGGAILGLFIDPNDYKSEIEQKALETANINLQINGDIGWSIYPSIGLDISSIKASFINQDSLAALDSARVSIMLIPLLSGDIKVKAVTIKGLELNLVKSASGNNWQPQTAATTESETTDSSDASQPSEKQPNIDIESISIIDANVTYTDQVTGDVSSISAFNLTTDRIVLGQAFNAQLSFNAAISQAKQQLFSAETIINGNFSLDPAMQRFKISALDLQLKINADKNLQLQLKADIDANLAANSIAVDNLQINSFDLQANGALKLTGPQLATITGNLALETFDLKALLHKLQVSEIQTADDSSLRKVSLSTQIRGSVTQINFDQLHIKIDQTSIRGTASYNLDSAMANFNLKGDSLNTNKYLAANTQSSNSTNASATPSTSKSASGYAKDIIIPIQPLQDLKLKGELTFAQLIYQKTTISNLDLKLDAKDGLVKILKLNMHAYGASINNKITLDARKKNLKISIKNTTKKLQIGPILADFAQADVLTGLLSTSSNITASGQSVHSIVNSLNGKVQFTLADGVVKGINAAQKMCETINSISSLGGTISTTKAVDKSTPFASIKGTLNIKNGVISNNNFKADLDAINIAGKGSVNLPLQSLNYRVGLKIQDNLFKKSCSVNNKIQGIEWPVDCKGKFSDDPMKLCKPDLKVVADLAKQALKAKLEKKLGGSIKEKKKELRKKVEDKVKDKLQGVLKGLF
ncbi:MAG: hypothetical protein OFPII_42540 [Osedax symbiont Rs1]|nr:MAG: hypothetical protein OFPII_42540 [Osedax symbiont Rs1]